MSRAIKITVIAIVTILGTVAMLAMSDDGGGLVYSAIGEFYFNRSGK